MWVWSLSQDGSGIPPGPPLSENRNPLQYSCLKNPMDRGAGQVTVHRITRSQTWQKQLSCMLPMGRLSCIWWWNILRKNLKQKWYILFYFRITAEVTKHHGVWVWNVFCAFIPHESISNRNDEGSPALLRAAGISTEKFWLLKIASPILEKKK